MFANPGAGCNVVDDGYTAEGGTSFAAPMVAGVAGLLQAIRTPGSSPMTPDRLRTVLVQTADDISATWRPLTMKRLNALSAVRSVLRASDTDAIYVADRRLPNAPDRAGKI